MADAEQERTPGPQRGRRRDGRRPARGRPAPARPPSRRPTSCGSRPQREAEQARAAADREVQEARRTLAVEKERLAREATEHHASATAETKRLVEEAEERATAAEQRAREATAQATEPPRAGRTPSPRPLLSRARREAEQIVASARTQADSIGSTAHAEAAARAGRRSGPRSTGMSKRRDAITAQLASLRDVVAGFAATTPTTRPALDLRAPEARRPSPHGRALRPRTSQGRHPGARARPSRTTADPDEDGRGRRPRSARPPPRPALAVLHRLLRWPRLRGGGLAVPRVRAHRRRADPHRRRAVPRRGPQPRRSSGSSDAGLRRSLAVLDGDRHLPRARSRCSCGRSCRSSPTRSRRSPTTPPSGSTSCSATGRSRTSTTEFDVIDKVRDYVAGRQLRHRPLRRRPRARPARAGGAGQHLPHHRADAVLPVLPRDDQDGPLPPGPGLAPRAGQQARRPGHRERRRLRRRRVRRRALRRCLLADLPVRRRAGRVRRRAGVRGRRCST